MSWFIDFPYKPSVAGESTTNYYDPVEIVEIEDEDYEIVELDE